MYVVVKLKALKSRKAMQDDPLSTFMLESAVGNLRDSSGGNLQRMLAALSLSGSLNTYDTKFDSVAPVQINNWWSPP